METKKLFHTMYLIHKFNLQIKTPVLPEDTLQDLILVGFISPGVWQNTYHLSLDLITMSAYKAYFWQQICTYKTL